MKTKTTALLLILCITHAPAREHLPDPPATSVDIFLASQRQAEDNARIMAQNERMIEAQERAARRAETARIYASLAASPAPVRPVPQPPVQADPYPPGYFAEMAERVTREKRARAALITEAAILAAAAEIRSIRASAMLSAAEKQLNVDFVISKLTTP